MAATFTVTTARTSTFTEARVRYVMSKVLEDLAMVAVCGFAPLERVTGWHEEVQAVLFMESVELFQVKLERPDGRTAAINYAISDDGSLSEDSASGGLNYFDHPRGTKASIVLRLRTAAHRRQEAVSYLKARGWSFDGSILEGPESRDRAYSSNGFGLTRKTIGWQ